jgi:hypothetical protein
MDHSIHMSNNLPYKKTQRYTIELFTSTSHQNYDHLQRFNVWGSPIYMLQPELQDATKIGKWLPRACWDMYLGVYPEQLSSFELSLNLETCFIYPQFHVIHDGLSSPSHLIGTMAHFIPTIGTQSYNQSKNVTVIPTQILPHWPTSGCHSLSKQSHSSDVNSIIASTPLR